METFASSLDALADWRRSLDRRIVELARFLGEHELLDGPPAEAAESLRQRLASDKLVVAFVAEFSRGKSELINAIFFADTGRRVLPATPRRLDARAPGPVVAGPPGRCADRGHAHQGRHHA
jgi:hypothetical protein